MAQEPNNLNPRNTLRQRAEELVQPSLTDINGMTELEIRKLIQDLQTHQIELELQTEELREAQVELTQSRDRFSDLYDFAPVGYLSQDKYGKILEANLAAAALLGVQRRELLGANINRFLDRDSQDEIYLHRQAVLTGSASRQIFDDWNEADQSQGISSTKQAIELPMHKADGTSLFVRLESIAYCAENGRHCRTALIDVTTVKRAQQLMESERRYHRLTEAVTDWVYHVRVENGRAVDTSHGPNCVAVTGYTPEEFAASPLLWIAIVPPVDRDRVKRHAANILTNTYSGPIEHRIQRKDGEIRWVLDTISPIHDERGNLIAYDGLVRDITDRKVAEEALHELNENLEQRVVEKTSEVKLLAEAVSHLGEGVMITSDKLDWPGPQIVFANEAMCRITGYDLEEMVGQTPRILQGDATNRDTLDHIKNELSADRSCLVEVVNNRKDGTLYDAELFITPLFNAQGHRTNFVSIQRDITERKRTEQQLRIKEQAIASAAAGIVLTDLAGTITYANPAFVRMLGYDSPNQIVGRSNSEFSSSEQHVGEVMDGLHEHGSWVGERVAKKKDGTLLDIDVVASVVHDSDGKVACFMASFVDIADRKQAERDMRASEAHTSAVLASLSSHISVVDRRGIIVAANPAWKAFARENDGAVPRCSEGANYLEVCRNATGEFSSEASTVADGLQAILDGRINEFSLEYPCHSAKQERWFLLQATSLENEEVGAVVSHTNITKRVKAEQDLRASEERMRAILGAAADAIITIDRTGIIKGANPATENMFGYTQEELVGQNVSILMPPPYCDEHDGYIARYLETGEARIIGSGREVVGRRKDGSIAPVELAVSEVDHLGLFVGIIRDISARKNAEEAWRREHELSEKIINTAPAIVLVLDTRGRILRLNPFFQQLTGWRLDEVQDKDWFETFLRKDVRNQAREWFNKAIHNEQTDGKMNTVLTKDGRELDIEWYNVPLADGEGQLVGLLCAGQDMTERQLLEREILDITAEEQRRIGSDLHDGVCQELIGLGMLTQGLANMLSDEKVAQVLRNAGISHLCELTQKISDGISDASRHARDLSHGLIPVDIDAHGLMAALGELASSIDSVHDINCIFEHSRPIELYDNFTATHLYRVAQEAVGNALKHSQAKQIRLSISEDDGQIFLVVKDDGIGIWNMNHESRGMGLRIMKYRASLIGATIDIESGPHGTVVRCSCAKAKDQGKQ